MPSSKAQAVFLALALAAPAFAQGQTYGPEPAPQGPVMQTPIEQNQVYGPMPAGPTPVDQELPLRGAMPIEVPATQTAPIRPSIAPPHVVLDDARAAVRAGQPQQALSLCQEYIAANPGDPEGFFWQGLAFDNLNQLDPALLAYQKAIDRMSRLGFDSAELRLNVGNIYLKQGRTEQAIAEYTKALKIEPRFAVAELNMARAQLLNGDAQKALAALARCDDAHCDPVQLQYYRAKALLKLGRREDAKQQIKMVLANIPPGNEISGRIASEFADLLK